MAHCTYEISLKSAIVSIQVESIPSYLLKVWIFLTMEPFTWEVWWFWFSWQAPTIEIIICLLIKINSPILITHPWNSCPFWHAWGASSSSMKHTFFSLTLDLLTILLLEHDFSGVTASWKTPSGRVGFWDGFGKTELGSSFAIRPLPIKPIPKSICLKLITIQILNSTGLGLTVRPSYLKRPKKMQGNLT